MYFSKCKNFKVINNPTRPESIYMKVKDTESQIIKETKLNISKICDIDVKI